jgi:hypothetical protein
MMAPVVPQPLIHSINESAIQMTSYVVALLMGSVRCSTRQIRMLSNCGNSAIVTFRTPLYMVLPAMRAFSWDIPGNEEAGFTFETL